MRNEVLRDVLAGCAGALAVAAVIGLPNGTVMARMRAESGVHHAVLLPDFSMTRPPPAPQVFRPRITRP
jgi:hypothetical protein